MDFCMFFQMANDWLYFCIHVHGLFVQMAAYTRYKAPTETVFKLKFKIEYWYECAALKCLSVTLIH